MRQAFTENYSIIPRTDSNSILYNNDTEDLPLVTKFHPRQIWQLVEENDIQYLKPGHSDCNAINFLVTIEGWETRAERYFI